MNHLSADDHLKVIQLLVEGNSLRGISRITGHRRNTCTRLLERFGAACKKFLRREMKDLQLRHIEIDEIWTFCRKKDKKITGEEPDVGQIGSMFIFVALDEDSRLVPVYRVGERNSNTTRNF